MERLPEWKICPKAAQKVPQGEGKLQCVETPARGGAVVGAGHQREQHPWNNWYGKLKGGKNDRAKWAKLSARRAGVELNWQEKDFFTLMQNAH